MKVQERKISHANTNEKKNWCKLINIKVDYKTISETFHTVT